MTHPLLAVHIADGVLSWPWLAAGFAAIGALAALACWRLREDEVPRVALLSAAFFVASSIHVKLGPTSVHLLLNGLVGVVLGWRAPLAILLGVALQAVLIPHGGLTTIGVNAAAQAIPALLAGLLFAPLARACGSPWARSLVVGASALLWGGCLLFGAAALYTGGLADLVRISGEAGVVFSGDALAPALAICLHPAALAALLTFTAICALAHPYFTARPEVPAGAFLGVASVILTLALSGGVLLCDGAETWGRWVPAVFVAHLPLALLEGLLLGVTAGFLARVKPAMLRLPEAAPSPAVLAVAALLLTAAPARAHLLKAEVTAIDRAARTVTLESWYETGDAPRQATAKVYRADGTLLTEGRLEEGTFAFSYEAPERLRVVIDAEGGHSKEVVVTAEELGGGEAPAPRREGSRWRDLLAGLALLALAALLASRLMARRAKAAPAATIPEQGRPKEGGT